MKIEKKEVSIVTDNSGNKEYYEDDKEAIKRGIEITCDEKLWSLINTSDVSYGNHDKMIHRFIQENRKKLFEILSELALNKSV